MRQRSFRVPYGPRDNAFNGVINGIQLATAQDANSADHMVSAEQAIAVAMVRQ
jgi:hypothetical protein